VRIYLNRHKEANASADDFWHALDEASGQDVTSIMNAWIKEPGHPIVTVAAHQTDGGLELELSQTRYYSDRDATSSGQRWPVPLVLKYGTATGIKEQRVLLRDAAATVTLAGARWVYPNAGGRGFYRWQLDDAADRLLDEGVRQLAPEERLSLIDNMWALTRTGRTSLASFLRRLDTLAGEEDRTVIASISDALSWLSSYAVRERTEAPFARFIDAFYRPIFEKVGWRPRDGEDTDTREKRGRVIGMLGFHARAADVRRGALDRALRHLEGSEPLHPDGAGVILSVAATDGDDRLWDRYVARMQAAQQSDAQEEARFRQALVAFEDEHVAQRTADAIFSPVIRTQDRGLMIIPFLQGRRTRDAGWNAVRERWDTDIVTAEPLLKQRFVNAVSQLQTERYRDDAIAFLESKRTPDIDETVSQSVERLRINTAAAERLARELDEALAAPAGR
jgi:puromycin-sensitive aminopeptidase